MLDRGNEDDKSIYYLPEHKLMGDVDACQILHSFLPVSCVWLWLHAVYFQSAYNNINNKDACTVQHIARLPALYVTGQKYERQLIGEGCKITVLSHTHPPTP